MKKKRELGVLNAVILHINQISRRDCWRYVRQMRRRRVLRWLRDPVQVPRDLFYTHAIMIQLSQNVTLMSLWIFYLLIELSLCSGTRLLKLDG